MKDLHKFWFGNIEITPEYYERQIRRWFFREDKLFDDECRNYLELQTSDPLLQILMYDQLPRNVFRGSPLAFQNDLKAQGMALKLIDTPFERSLTLPERIFLYMPLEHAEDLKLQDLSVEKFYALHIEAPKEIRPWTLLGLNKAIDHKKTVQKYGCFPQRPGAVIMET